MTPSPKAAAATEPPLRNRINDPDRTRADILDVAAEHFATNGFSGSRVDDIAEQTQTSKRMLYYYFGSKEGLYRAVLARAYAGIRMNRAGIDLAAMPPREALARLVELTFDQYRDNPAFVRLVMVENIHRGAYISEVAGISDRARSVLGILDALLARGRAEGVFREGVDALDVYLTMSGLGFYNVSNSHTVAHIFAHDPMDEEIASRRRQTIVEVITRWLCL